MSIGDAGATSITVDKNIVDSVIDKNIVEVSDIVAAAVESSSPLSVERRGVFTMVSIVGRPSRPRQVDG